MNKAAALRALHVPGEPVVLPNVWDVATARVMAKAGFPAVATGSAAVAASLGYRDGHAAPANDMLAAAGRIARAVDVPVTADMEGGYDLAPAALAGRLIDEGVSGLNFEDTDHAAGGGTLLDTTAQAERIAALRDAAGDRLVINARVDVFLHGGEVTDDLCDAGLARARAYAAAGADVVFPIVLSDETALESFVRQAGAPVNAFWRGDGPSLGRLAELGVARVSFGSAIQRAALGRVRAVADALRAGDDSVLREP